MVEVGVRRLALSEVATPLLAVGAHKDAEVSFDVAEDAAEDFSDFSDFSGEEGATLRVQGGEKLAARHLLLVGLGEPGSFTLEKLRRVSASIAREAREIGVEEAAFALPALESANVEDAARSAAEGAALGLYHFARYKTGNTDDEKPRRFDLVLNDRVDEDEARREAFEDA